MQYFSYLKVDRYFDDVDAHVNNVASGGAVVTGTRVALQGVGQVPTIQKVIAQIIVASSNALLEIF